jgi:carbamoyl-phosphate synthase large subunit
MATHGTAAMLRRVGVKVQAVNKVSEGEPHVLDLMRAGEVSLIINTPLGSSSFSDGHLLRQEAARLGIPLITTLTAAQAAINGIKTLATRSLEVRSLQALHNLAERPSPHSESSPQEGEENEAAKLDYILASSPHTLFASS